MERTLRRISTKMGSKKSFETVVVTGNHMKSYGDFHPNVQFYPGIDDSLIQPYSGHSTRQSLEVYSKLSINEAQEKYDEVINKFPV